ncbi:MAG: acyloxyacyl hydrolase [Rhizobiaceae bacterium]
MKNKFITLLAAGAAFLGAHAPATANDLQIDEARFGGSLIDIPTPDRQSYYRYNLPGVNAEVLFTPFDFEMGDEQSEGFLREVFTPRLHVGATIALDDYSPSSVYTGLTWHHALGEILFIESSFGATLHNGEMNPVRYSATKQKRGLGSPLLFRESLSVGANLTDTMTMVLQISHMSHAGLAGDNNSGQTDLALKLGHKF